jgi:hypothetical protein
MILSFRFRHYPANSFGAKPSVMAGSAAAVPAGAGAFDLTDLGMWARRVPYDEFARLRREAPVAWHDDASPNSGFWSVHCYQDILTASSRT